MTATEQEADRVGAPVVVDVGGRRLLLRQRAGGRSSANDTSYGLASYLFTRDLSRALRVAEVLDSGIPGVNRGVVSNPAAPFGGLKESGLGRQGGAEGLEEYLATRYIGVQL